MALHTFSSLTLWSNALFLCVFGGHALTLTGPNRFGGWKLQKTMKSAPTHDLSLSSSMFGDTPMIELENATSSSTPPLLDHLAYDDVENEKRDNKKKEQQHDFQLEAANILHKTKLEAKLDEIEREMKQNQYTANKMMLMLERDVEMQSMLRRQSKQAMDQLQLVKSDLIRQLQDARQHYQEDMSAMQQKHVQEIQEKDAVIAAKEQELQSFRRLGTRALGLIRSRLTRQFRRVFRLGDR